MADSCFRRALRFNSENTLAREEVIQLHYRLAQQYTNDGNVNDAIKKRNQKQQQLQSEQNYDTLWTNEDKSIKVVMPRTKSASVKLGRGAKWCTAADTSPGDDYDPDHYFCKYVLNENDPGMMIYILNYNLPKDDPFQKTAIRLSGYDVNIEEIRDMNNSENYAEYGGHGQGWDDKYEEYLKKWDIPLEEILEETYVDDLDSERYEFSEAQFDKIYDSVQNKFSDDLPDNIKDIVNDMLSDARSDLYSYGADDVNDLEDLFDTWVYEINNIYDEVKKENIQDDVNWDDIIYDIIQQNNSLNIDDVLEHHTNDDVLDNLYNEKYTQISSIINNMDIDDEFKDEFVNTVGTYDYAHINKIHDILSNVKAADKFRTIINILNNDEFANLLTWDDVISQLKDMTLQTYLNKDIPSILYTMSPKFKNDKYKNELLSVLNDPDIINNLIEHDTKMTDGYVFNLLGGPEAVDKNPEEMANKFISIIKDNYNDIKKKYITHCKKYYI
jgi:hypothetical protein